MRGAFNSSEKIAAVTAFDPILQRLDMIADPRRGQGKRFEQLYVLLDAGRRRWPQGLSRRHHCGLPRSDGSDVHSPSAAQLDEFRGVERP
jgi:hypothetical protein